MTTLAIDQGTTSTRAMTVDDNGAANILASAEHRQFYPRPGWVEHDPAELLAQVRAGIDAGRGIRAIGIDNQGESCLGWNAVTGAAVSPVIVWQDDRTRDVTERLRTDGAESLVLDKAGLPLDPYFSAAKLAWILRHVPAAAALHRRGELRLGTTDAFFLQHLTGECVTDITTASRTSLMNIEHGGWDPELCALFGVPRETLPRIVPTTGELGQVRAGGREIALTASVVDQQAALFGHGCRAPGDTKITFGTGAFALSLTGEHCQRAPEQGLLPTIAWQRAGAKPVYALDGGVYCASSALNWARGLGLFERFEEISSFAGPAAIERGLVFVPALSGLACPHWERSARGAWFGLSLDTAPLEMVRAILEGVALRAAEVLSAMGRHTPAAGPVSIDGGMSANPYFCQFLCNLLQRPLQLPGMAELTAFGTAMLARPAGQDLATPAAARVYYPQADAGAWPERFAQAVQLTRQW